MAICSDKMIFYHIPKTGGIWFKSAIRRGGVKYGRANEMPRTGHVFGLKREHSTSDTIMPKYKNGRVSCAFVRKPVQWYKSFYAYRIRKLELKYQFPLDRLWNSDFEIFIQNVLDNYPNGFLLELYEMYQPVDITAHYERLIDNTIDILNIIGETFDEEKVRTCPPANTNGGYKKYAVLSKELEQRLVDSEKEMLGRYYKNGYGLIRRNSSS